VTISSANYLAQLHALLDRAFDLEELRTLCFELNVDYDSLRGEGKSARIRELLLALGRSGRLSQLITQAQTERPHLDWPDVPTDFQLPASLASGSTDAPANQYHVYGDMVQGDKVGGDKVGGDKISVGNISGSQGIAIGRGAKADVNIQHGVSGEALNQLFAPLLAQVAREDTTAVPKVQALKAEVEKGEDADDEKMADLIGDIVEAAPSVVESIVNLFTSSVIAKVAGGATKYVLKRLQ